MRSSLPSRLISATRTREASVEAGKYAGAENLTSADDVVVVRMTAKSSIVAPTMREIVHNRMRVPQMQVEAWSPGEEGREAYIEVRQFYSGMRSLCEVIRKKV